MMKKVRLSAILLDEQFRKDLEDLSLTLSMVDNQSVPIIVEGPTNNNEYFLVEGYRRLASLKHLQKKHVYCIVEKITNEEERVIKRLRNELHTKKKTGYEISRMVNFLLDREYTIPQIANKCGKTEATIRKYVRSRDVDSELLERAERNGAGVHGLTELNKLNNIKENTKHYTLDNYVEKNISGTHVESIKKVHNINEFINLSDDSQRKCIDGAVCQTKFNEHRAKTIVYEESLRHKYDKKVHKYIFNVVVSYLEKTIANCHLNFIQNLSNEQKTTLQGLLENFASKLGITINWSAFPDDTVQNNFGKRHLLININDRKRKTPRSKRHKEL
jgi:ParB family chromosome partitioning protein